MKRSQIVLLVLLALPWSRSWADENLVWMGAGAASCAEFAKAYQQDPEHMERLFLSWTQGFMSGLNEPLFSRKAATNLNAWSIEKQKLILRLYCNDHPLDLYVGAVFHLYNQMRHDQGLGSWESSLSRDRPH